jgi:hypothetical protein
MNVYLEITPDEATQMAAVRVSCTVRYRDEEVAMMVEAPASHFCTLFCQLFGRDAGTVAPLDTDDLLYSFPTLHLPQGAPRNEEEILFEVNLGYNVLNEDLWGKDEIYADLVLRGCVDFQDQAQQVRSNTIAFAF